MAVLFAGSGLTAAGSAVAIDLSKTPSLPFNDYTRVSIFVPDRSVAVDLVWRLEADGTVRIVRRKGTGGAGDGKPITLVLEGGARLDWSPSSMGSLVGGRVRRYTKTRDGNLRKGTEWHGPSQVVRIRPLDNHQPRVLSGTPVKPLTTSGLNGRRVSRAPRIVCPKNADDNVAIRASNGVRRWSTRRLERCNLDTIFNVYIYSSADEVAETYIPIPLGGGVRVHEQTDPFAVNWVYASPVGAPRKFRILQPAYVVWKDISKDSQTAVLLSASAVAVAGGVGLAISAIFHLALTRRRDRSPTRSP